MSACLLLLLLLHKHYGLKYAGGLECFVAMNDADKALQASVHAKTVPGRGSAALSCSQGAHRDQAATSLQGFRYVYNHTCLALVLA